ncbi:class I SAM-dependent methyltransferase [Candidatus Pacearchaeota archaeon]|nr:class I SAM-dependent methyltransferase [Candidatus Pacearchaeota archaeon]
MKKEENYETLNKIWQESYEIGSPTFLIRQKLIKKLIKNSIKNNFLVLDIGCGNGYYIDLLIKYNPKYYGVDLSNFSIENLKEKYPKLNYYCGDFMHFNIKKKFDLIIMSEVLEHIENEDKMLKKIHYLLKKDGKLILSVPFDQNLWSRSDELVNHKRRYTKKYLKMIIEKNGFKINDMVCYGFPLLRIYWLLKKNFMKDSSIKPIKPKKSMIKKIFFKTINKIFLLDLLLTNTNKGVGLITICSNNSVK